MNEFDEIPVGGDDEAVMVKERRRSGVVKRDRASFVVIRKNIHKGQRRVNDLAIVYGVNGSLAG